MGWGGAAHGYKICLTFPNSQNVESKHVCCIFHILQTSVCFHHQFRKFLNMNSIGFRQPPAQLRQGLQIRCHLTPVRSLYLSPTCSWNVRWASGVNGDRLDSELPKNTMYVKNLGFVPQEIGQQQENNQQRCRCYW